MTSEECPRCGGEPEPDGEYCIVCQDLIDEREGKR